MLYFTFTVSGICLKHLFLSGILLRIEKVVTHPEQQTAYLEKGFKQYPGQTTDLFPFLLEKPRHVVAAAAGQGCTPVPSLMPPFSLAAAGLPYPVLHFTPPLHEGLATPSPCLPNSPQHEERKGYLVGKIGKVLLKQWQESSVKEERLIVGSWKGAGGGGGWVWVWGCVQAVVQNPVFWPNFIELYLQYPKSLISHLTTRTIG